MSGVKCELIAYEKNGRTKVIFYEDKWSVIKFQEYIDGFKNDYHIKKLTKVENNIEEIIFERGE